MDEIAPDLVSYARRVTVCRLYVCGLIRNAADGTKDKLVRLLCLIFIPKHFDTDIEVPPLQYSLTIINPIMCKISTVGASIAHKGMRSSDRLVSLYAAAGGSLLGPYAWTS